MRKRIWIYLSLAIILSLALATGVQAATTKYSFNDVYIDGTIVEIEASVKDNKKNDFSQCTYFSDDYQEALGYYSDAVVAGDSAEEVLDFCVDHFYERSQ